MKNGPGYLDVAVSSHLDMLKVGETVWKRVYNVCVEKGV